MNEKKYDESNIYSVSWGGYGNIMVFFSITIDSIHILSKPFDGASSYGSNGSLFVFEFDFYEKIHTYKLIN